MIRIVIADPAARVRPALRMRLELEPDMSVIAECASLECAEREVVAQSADVLVVDLAGDDTADAQSVSWLRDRALRCGVVLLSMDERLRRLAGARTAFVSKYDDESAVVAAVRGACAHHVPVQPGPDRAAPTTTSSGGDGLVPRT